jgi:predicted outer membrane protein
MRRAFIVALAAIALLLVQGCSKQSETTAAAPGSAPAAVTSNGQLTPEQLGELGAQIKKHPSDAERLLSEHGLSDQSFEQAIRKVSSDPAASRRYAEAFKRNS